MAKQTKNRRSSPQGRVSRAQQTLASLQYGHPTRPVVGQPDLLENIRSSTSETTEEKLNGGIPLDGIIYQQGVQNYIEDPNVEPVENEVESVILPDPEFKIHVYDAVVGDVLDSNDMHEIDNEERTLEEVIHEKVQILPESEVVLFIQDEAQAERPAIEEEIDIDSMKREVIDSLDRAGEIADRGMTYAENGRRQLHEIDQGKWVRPEDVRDFVLSHVATWPVDGSMWSKRKVEPYMEGLARKHPLRKIARAVTNGWGLKPKAIFDLGGLPREEVANAINLGIETTRVFSPINRLQSSERIVPPDEMNIPHSGSKER